MNRRGFLESLTAALATATLDPERFLWGPGKRLISVAAPLAEAIEYIYGPVARGLFPRGLFPRPWQIGSSPGNPEELVKLWLQGPYTEDLQWSGDTRAANGSR